MKLSDTELVSIGGTPGGGQESQPNKPSGTSLPELLPILGLSDIVVFPGMVVPLVVASARGIRLIDNVVAGDRFVALVLQKEATIEDPGPDQLWRVGCLSRVARMLKFPDNTVRVLVEGLRRIRILSFESQEPYLQGKYEVLKEVSEDSLEVVALVRNLRDRFAEVIDLSPALVEQVKVAVMNIEDPGRLADLVAANLNLSLEERQRLLEAVNVKDRLRLLLPLVSRELEVLKLGSKIQKEVSSSMSKSQRDYFLREQLRAIQRELGEGESGSEIENLQELINKAELPEEPRKVAQRELDRLRQIPPAVAEYTVIRNYLDWIVNLPWSKSTRDKLDIDAAERLLNKHHYGLEKVKERLLEYLAVLKLKGQIRGPILCLVGPPGVGKTSLARSVADALGRKFVRISLGGMRDEAEIRGHRRTYVGALPGRIMQSLRRVEVNNPVMLLDELDKIGSDFRGDPAAALLEVLDPEQNSAFIDHYIDLPFDLSGVLFITTANWLDPIHPALRDRLEVIEIPSYTLEEKVQIARRHLVPKQREEHGLPPRLFALPVTTLRCLIRDYTREAGVRQLDRELAAIMRKIARRQSTSRASRSPKVIRPADLASLLGPAKFLPEKAEAKLECGIATGLAWTPFGGEILYIEATRMPGSGKLTLTGSLGDVMKESAQAALSYLRSQATALGLPEIQIEKQEIHIHVPAGATPKDGPSAGLTIAAALASLFSQRPISPHIAMTGEISLRGRVLPVGGIKEKVLAAARAGIKELILPGPNKKDWNEVPPEVRCKLKVHFVDRISDAIALVLGSPRSVESRRDGHPNRRSKPVRKSPRQPAAVPTRTS
ncbi:MAG: endopeptidase La [Verrucomicrobiota bacterium]|nr:endopeptidase La [Verrucomicrobiota bacterium]